MIKSVIKYLSVFILLSFFSVACSEYQRLLKSDDAELKLEKAIEYYEDGDYFRAQTLLSDIRSYYRGTEKAELLNYYNAYCHYGMGELALAAYFFKDFARQFPNSDKREEAEFMSAYCLYLLSPQPSLEQTYTKEGIKELQLFIDRYPKSEKRDSANVLIDNLQQRLELKAFKNAKLYYKIGSYRAAVVALNNVLIDYPDTDYREQILFYIVKSKYNFAGNSVIQMQYDRYKKTIDAYYEFVDLFSESEKIREAEKIYENSIKFIKEYEGL